MPLGFGKLCRSCAEGVEFTDEYGTYLNIETFKNFSEFPIKIATFLQ